MEIVEHMYYGFGRVLLALSMADGRIDWSEVKSLEENINMVAEQNGIDLSMVNASFHQWRDTKSFSAEEMMRGGIRDFHLGDQHLTPELARIFRSLVIDMVSAEDPITRKEEEMAHEFISYLNEREKKVN